jgi:DNA-binding CsgD family transcriptional regulator
MEAMPAAIARQTRTHVDAATFALWERLAEFPAGATDAQLRCMQDWLACAIRADNVIWIGAVRVLRGARARGDPFLGWRLRGRATLKPEPEAYREQHAAYYANDHYGRLTRGYYERSHSDRVRLVHAGMTGTASLAGAGAFRVHCLRDPEFLDYAAFRHTEHYRLYYRIPGIVDRMTIGYPVDADSESFFLIDRYRARADGGRGRPFSARDAAIAGGAVRGVRALHRQTLMSHGLLGGDKLLSPVERQILFGLVRGDTERAIAAALGQKPATLHKYVRDLHARFGVRSRAELMAMWFQ